MKTWFKNIAYLASKEFRSLLTDVTLLLTIVFAFSVAVVSVAKGVKAEVANASVAVVDFDRSTLSHQIRDAVLPPYFQSPELIETRNIDEVLDTGKYIFVLNIPAHFERDVLAGRSPKIQLLVDATAMTQAGVGVVDLQQIFTQSMLQFLQIHHIENYMPVKTSTRVFFNPNGQSAWFTAMMQIVINVTILSIILVGAAVIREREHGTIEHLLVMPVRASEIALAKILTNGSVILVAALLSMWLVAHGILGVPIHGSVWLYALGTAIYLFSVTSLGMYIATMAPTMPQFGLLSAPVAVVLYLLSGAATPVESMPSMMQWFSQILPTRQYVAMTQHILYRGAGWSIVWPELAMMSVMGIIFLWAALGRFRSMLDKQG
jgi:ABC-2 type transport system permease protein